MKSNIKLIMNNLALSQVRGPKTPVEPWSNRVRPVDDHYFVGRAYRCTDAGKRQCCWDRTVRNGTRANGVWTATSERTGAKSTSRTIGKPRENNERQKHDSFAPKKKKKTTIANTPTFFVPNPSGLRSRSK